MLAALYRLAALAALGLGWLVACSPTPPVETPLQPTPVSLLLATPYIGNETEIRDPAPEPTRLVLVEESVEGWMAPPERLLRFPVEIREGARLTFRLGAESETAVNAGDILFRVEFASQSTDAKTEIVYEPNSLESLECLRTWHHVDIPLDQCAPGRGELRFVVDGRLANDPALNILWGQPAIYYPEERRHRNVLLIGVDTLRADGLSLYDGRLEVTPSLQALSETATLFTQARSQTPWTVSSFASMVTGCFPSAMGPTIPILHLPERATTLSEILFPLGFTTATICGNPHLGNDQSGFHQGMEGLWYRVSATPRTSVNKTREFISRSMDRDWFCFLHFMDPHGSYDPPQEYVDLLCDPNYRGPYELKFEDGRDWQLLEAKPPDAEVRQVRNLYDGEVADVDASLQLLFDFLEENGLMEETLIILAADHGEEFFEHGKFEHGQSLYDEMIRLPLMLWGPGFPGGEHIDTCVANIDIVPTILRHLDLPIPDSLPGIPLQDLAADSEQDRAGAPAFQPARIIFGEGNLRRGSHQKFAVDWPYKCILDFFTGEARLYDLIADPIETEDIGESHPEIVERLSREIVLAMLPMQTTFIMFITGDRDEIPHIFAGTLRIPGGIGVAHDSGFSEDDEFIIEGDTIAFRIGSKVTLEHPVKALIIFPSVGGNTLEATVRVDGRIDPNRFFPYASDTPEPSGSATVSVYDLPWPARLPPDALDSPAACYIVGIPSLRESESAAGLDTVELDPRTIEELRALGYVN